MTLLCLIAALSGSPLRQAEAAYDLARSLDELAGDHVIETIDGGVGDDSGETVLKAGAESQPDTTTADEPPSLLTPVLPLSLDASRRAERAVAPLPGPLQRHAWLQRFLF
jgi:hypothetical protein